MHTHIALPEKTKAQLESLLELYHKANDDFESAIQAEAWGKLKSIQFSRDLQAYAITEIIVGCSIVSLGEVT